MMQINKIANYSLTNSVHNQKVTNRPISFGWAGPGAYIYKADQKDSVGFPSTSDMINSNVAEKEALYVRAKNEAKETLKQVKEVFNGRTFKSNPMRIEGKNGSYQECFFENEDKPFEILKVNKHTSKMTKEFIFHGKNMVSYTEYDEEAAIERNIIPTRGKGFAYTVTKNYTGYPEMIKSITVTGLRGNDRSTYTSYENGEKKKYIYNSKACKWNLVKNK